MSNPENSENKTTHERQTKRQRPKPGFMSMSWLRLHIKEIIWAVIITFLISLFFIGYGTSRQNAKREEREQQFDNKEAQEAALKNMLPEKLQGKENLPAVIVSYGSEAASLTSVIDVKTLYRTIKDNPEYIRFQSMPKGIKEYYVNYLKESTISRLSDYSLLNLYAQANKIVPNISINDIVNRDKQQISEKEFNRALRKKGISIEEYGQERLRDVTVQMVSQSAITQVAPASATEDFMKNYYETNKECFKKDDKISFDHLLIDPSEFSSDEGITDEQISAYYEANKASFMSSKRIEASHIYIKTVDDNYLNQIVVSETDLKNTYNENLGRFTTPEQVKASHILIKPRGNGDEEAKFAEARKVADALYERAKKGEDFAKLATENSEDEGSAKNGGDLGYFGRGMMVKPFEDAAFASAVDAITEPVKSQFGYHIIKVTDKKQATVKSFDEAKAELMVEAKAKQAETKAETDLTELQAKVANGYQDFAKSVKQYSLGMSAKNNGKLPVFFKGQFTDDYTAEEKALLKEELGDGYDYIATEIEEQLFAMNPGNVSEVIKTQNGYHLFKVDNVLEPAQLKLTDTLKSKIKAILAQKNAEDAAAKEAEKLVKEHASAGIDALVKAYGKDIANKTTSFKDLPFSTNPGQDFSALSEGMGLFSDNGRLYLPEFHKQLVEAIKSNSLNKYLPPFKTAFGWHILKVTSYEGNQYEPYENVRDTIRRIVTFEPSDAEIDKFYEENKAQFDIPATRTIRQIVCEDEASAQKVKAELDAGAGFSIMAKQNSIDSTASNGGLMSPAAKGTFNKDLDDAIWALEKDQYTNPIKTPFGWVIAKLESETAEVKSAKDAGTISKIKRNLRETNRNEAWSYFMKGLTNKSHVVRNQEVIDLIE